MNFPEVFDDDKKLPSMIHDYNQTKVGVDLVGQCINKYTVRRIARRWPMIVFSNTIDIAAINAMTIGLCHHPDWNNRHTHARRLFLSELGLSLTKPHHGRRCQESHLSSKTKLALRLLGYELKRQPFSHQGHSDGSTQNKKRCYICPANPGRKVRQTCPTCQNHACNSHSVCARKTICQLCEKNVH
jgi:hypothetical protein